MGSTGGILKKIYGIEYHIYIYPIQTHIFFSFGENMANHQVSDISKKMLQKLNSEVRETLDLGLGTTWKRSHHYHSGGGIYMNIDVDTIGEWRIVYRPECAYNNLKPAMDIQHAYVYPEARRKGAMTQFVVSVAKWCADNGVGIESIYMLKGMAEGNEDWGRFWDGFGRKFGRKLIRDDHKVGVCIKPQP